MLAKRGKPEDAEAFYKKAVALDPEDIRVRSLYGNFLYEQTRIDEAVAQWQALLRLAPDHYPTLVNLGSVLTELNRAPEAATMLRQAIAIEPTYMAWSNLGTAFSRANRYDDAVEAYREALKIDDGDRLAWGNLGYVLSWSAPDLPETSEVFAKAIELAETARAPDTGEVLAAAAEAWEVMGERDNAIEFAKRALAAGHT